MKKHFGSWTVIKESGQKGRVVVRCSCGKESVKSLSLLKRGRTKRCWDCYMKLRKTRAQMKKLPLETVPDTYDEFPDNHKFIVIGTAILFGVAFSVFVAHHTCHLIARFLHYHQI